MTREERIDQAKQAAPIDRKQIGSEIRELELHAKLHPENAVIVYYKINALLEVLDEDASDREDPDKDHRPSDCYRRSEAEEPPDAGDHTRDILSAAKQTGE
jgi:hypothetical protein